MALIKCPKCNKDVSDTIKKCVHCDVNIKSELNRQKKIKLKLLEEKKEKIEDKLIKRKEKIKKEIKKEITKAKVTKEKKTVKVFFDTLLILLTGVLLGIGLMFSYYNFFFKDGFQQNDCDAQTNYEYLNEEMNYYVGGMKEIINPHEVNSIIFADNETYFMDLVLNTRDVVTFEYDIYLYEEQEVEIRPEASALCGTNENDCSSMIHFEMKYNSVQNVYDDINGIRYKQTIIVNIIPDEKYANDKGYIDIKLTLSADLY